MKESLPLKDGNREDLRNNFLKAHGLKSEAAIALPADGSRRRYFRFPQGLLMDAPPAYESTLSFERMGRLLEQLELSVPQIYVVDHINGFILLEDFGELSYRKAIAQGIDQHLLYNETIKALAFLHQKCSENNVEIEIPSYTLENFVANASLFLEWAPFSFSADAKADFKALWEHAYLTQPSLPRVLLLRDVMIDNLFWLPERKGVKRCGFIDFQDASWGPAVYDLTSVLDDTRREALEKGFVDTLLETYFQAFPDIPRDAFLASYCLWGAQRTTRILGGLCFRQSKRDGRHQYMALVPRLSEILEQSLRHPTLHGLRLWFTSQGFIK